MNADVRRWLDALKAEQRGSHDFLVWPSPRAPVPHVPCGYLPFTRVSALLAYSRRPLICPTARSPQKTSGEQEIRPPHDLFSNDLSPFGFFFVTRQVFLILPFYLFSVCQRKCWGVALTGAPAIPSRPLTLCHSIVRKVHELAVPVCQFHHVLFVIPFRRSLVPCLRPS